MVRALLGLALVACAPEPTAAALPRPYFGVAMTPIAPIERTVEAPRAIGPEPPEVSAAERAHAEAQKHRVPATRWELITTGRRTDFRDDWEVVSTAQ